MNKALPWNVNGVGFDAREAAREAARRQGKSLGEWLHGVIADHANHLGIDQRDVSSQHRIDAVTSKLERLSARSAEHDRRTDRSQDFTSRSSRQSDEEPRRREAVAPSRLRRSPSDETEYLLEEAIDAMERRARRTEQHTTDALNSLARLLERKEADRERERDAVSDLARKLSDIETRLSDNQFLQTNDNPIKGSLARLEARLDAIGRRSEAEAAARGSVDAGAKVEDKLDAILNAVNQSSSPLALSAARAPLGERRLGDAIDDIARRQKTLDRGDAPISLRDALLRRKDVPARREPAVERTPFAAMERDIAALSGRIDDLRRDIVGQRQAMPAPASDTEALRTQIAGVTSALRDLASRPAIVGDGNPARGRAPVASSPAKPNVDPGALAQIHAQMREIKDLVTTQTARPQAFDRLERQIETLARRIDEPVHVPPAVPAAAAGFNELGDAVIAKVEDRLQALDAKIDRVVDTVGNGPRESDPSLEALVRELSQRLDAVRAPDAGSETFDALQRQIALLSARFEQSSEGLGKLAVLERSMQDLFQHLEQTRTDVEASATRAAREALRSAVGDGALRSGEDAPALAAMKALQDQAEQRTNSTLSAVHETLERVVDRLAAMEKDIMQVRERPVQAPPATSALKMPAAGPRDAATTRPVQPRPAARDIHLGAPDPMFEHALGRLGDAAPADRARRASDDDGRADFIAAARRAAKTAQTDASVVELKRAAAAGAADADSPVRAGLVEQSRDYVARHKRPVLLGLAALFVVIGTMAIMQRIGLGSGDSQMADVATPAPIARMADNRSAVEARANDVLTPSALPKVKPADTAAIPGSEPVQASSITSLPSFAAQGIAQARPGLPDGLTARAKSGDSSAEYMLGAQYAEGRLVQRDFRLAAQWYQKAADQGLAPAKYRLASLYEKGLGLDKDKVKARTLYLEAAEAGNPRAMHNLAVLLADGDGKPDYDSAVTWFRKAAQYGIHDSQYNLAILLARGLGVQQSLLQSYQWFAIAAAQNDADAAKKRDEVATKLNANDLAVAKALAASFRPRVADIAATEVSPPPGGWDGVGTASPLNSARPKISSL